MSESRSEATDAQLDELLAALAAAPNIRRPGDRVTERVSLVRHLDRGGMGDVWVAHHDTLGVDVAVKFIRVATKQAMRRFTREARLAAKLTCPNSVRIYDHGLTSDGSPFIVMELLKGESLADRLERKGPLELEAVKDLITQLAAAIDEAHEIDVVHRDIKPSNVFLTDIDPGPESTPLVRLLDFGLARPATRDGDSTVTADGTLPGTARYMAPEQLIDGIEANPSSDLWALAVVAYEAISGRVPFVGPTPASIASAMREPLDLTSIPKAAHAWFRRALASKPGDRFRSALAMASSFPRSADGGGTDRSLYLLGALVGSAAIVFFMMRGDGDAEVAGPPIEPAPASTPTSQSFSDASPTARAPPHELSHQLSHHRRHRPERRARATIQ